MENRIFLENWRMALVPHSEVRKGFHAEHISELLDSDKKIIAADVPGNFELDLVREGLFKLGDLLAEGVDLVDAVDEVFAVEVAELDFGDVLSLTLVDREALAEICDDLGFLLGIADDLDRLVDVEQDLAETEEEM